MALPQAISNCIGLFYRSQWPVNEAVGDSSTADVFKNVETKVIVHVYLELARVRYALWVFLLSLQASKAAPAPSSSSLSNHYQLDHNTRCFH
jgi:hypothetical protein